MSQIELEQLESRFLLSGAAGAMLPMDPQPATVRIIEPTAIAVLGSHAGGIVPKTGTYGVPIHEPPVPVGRARPEVLGPVSSIVTQAYLIEEAESLPASGPVNSTEPAPTDPPAPSHGSASGLGAVALASAVPAEQASLLLDLADAPGGGPFATFANLRLARPVGEDIRVFYNMDGFRGHATALPLVAPAPNAPGSDLDLGPIAPEVPPSDEAADPPLSEPENAEQDVPEFLQALGRMAEQAASLPAADLAGLERALDDFMTQLGRFGTDIDLIHDRRGLWLYCVLSAVAAVAVCDIARRQQQKASERLAFEGLSLPSHSPDEDLGELP